MIVLIFIEIGFGNIYKYKILTPNILNKKWANKLRVEKINANGRFFFIRLGLCAVPIVLRNFRRDTVMIGNSLLLAL